MGVHINKIKVSICKMYKLLGVISRIAELIILELSLKIEGIVERHIDYFF